RRLAQWPAGGTGGDGGVHAAGTHPAGRRVPPVRPRSDNGLPAPDARAGLPGPGWRNNRRGRRGGGGDGGRGGGGEGGGGGGGEGEASGERAAPATGGGRPGRRARPQRAPAQ